MTEDAMPKRPWTVTTGVYMLCLSIGLLMIALLSRWSTIGMSDTFVPEVGTLLTLALIYYMIGKGRNGARIIFLIIVLLGTPFSVLSVIRPSGHSDLLGPVGAYLGYIRIIQIIIQLVAVVLLFQRASSHWFRTMKKLRSKDESHAAI